MSGRLNAARIRDSRQQGQGRGQFPVTRIAQGDKDVGTGKREGSECSDTTSGDDRCRRENLPQMSGMGGE